MTVALERLRARVRLRGDLVAVVAAVVLVAAAAIGGLSIGQRRIWAFAPPLFGDWAPHVGPGSPFAVLVAVGVVAWGPSWAERLAWRRAVGIAYGAGLLWTFSLAMIDGWSRGFAGRLTIEQEYLHEVGGITDIPAMLHGFTSRILAGQPNTWTTHVGGHPPGATLVFVWLDRLGLGGGAWASTVCVLAGGLIAVAVPNTLRALDRSDAARAVLPFVVLFPGAVWMGVSADGLFAGVTAMGIWALSVAAGRKSLALAALAGVALGFGIFLSYGLVLLGAVALAVAAYRRAWTVTAVAIAGALAVVAVFAAAGFWWLDGYHLVVERYYQGVGRTRPYSYWVWADLACVVLAVGPAVAAGIGRLNRRAGAVALLAVAAMVAIGFADVSGLSKAETERIWLPFDMWLLPLVTLLDVQHRRWWLGAQAATALAVNHLILTMW